MVRGIKNAEPSASRSSLIRISASQGGNIGRGMAYIAPRVRVAPCGKRCGHRDSSTIAQTFDCHSYDAIPPTISIQNAPQFEKLAPHCDKGVTVCTTMQRSQPKLSH